jgi:hypothetical protein
MSLLFRYDDHQEHDILEVCAPKFKETRILLIECTESTYLEIFSRICVPSRIARDQTGCSVVDMPGEITKFKPTDENGFATLVNTISPQKQT